MTVEELKKTYIDTQYSIAVEELKRLKTSFNALKGACPAIAEYKNLFRDLEYCKECARKIELHFEIKYLDDALSASYKDLIEKFDSEIERVNNAFESKVDSLIQNKKLEAKRANAEVRANFDKENSVYLALEEKRKQLEAYSPDVVEMSAQYGVLTSDVNMNNSSFRLEELNTMYDTFIAYMKKRKRISRNPIQLLRKYVPNVIIQGVILLVVLLLGFTELLDIIGIAMFIGIMIMQSHAKGRMETTVALMGLIYNVQPLQLGFKEDLESNLLKPEEVDEDEDEELNTVASEWEEVLEKLDVLNPQLQLQQELVNLVNNSAQIEQEFKEVGAKFEASRKALINEVDARIRKAEEDFELAKSNLVLLGTRFIESYEFRTTYSIGLKEGYFEEDINIGLRNIVIRPSRDEEGLTRFMQVLLANAITNVRAGLLSVIVYDPNTIGQGLITFYRAAIDSYFTLISDGLKNVVSDLKEYVQQNIKSMQGIDINAFNAEAYEMNKTPREYKLLIVLSQPKDLETDEALRSFMAYSAKYGVFIWLISTVSIPDTYVFERPFAGVEHPYVVDVKTFGKKISELWAATLKSKEDKGLNWDDVIKRLCPDEDTWKGTCDEFIELDPGYFEGDPAQHDSFTVGNVGNIHVFAVGGTGAGKSVFLNHLIATATKKYSPLELELWLVDYKGTEFSLYAGTGEGKFMLPHVKACLCTSDGDFAGSLFKEIRSIAETRYNVLKELGFKNMLEYNTHMRNAGTPEKCWTRILILNDEFQVIYRKAEDSVVTQLNKDITFITTVARAAGVHLFFASQSSKGTIAPDTMANFTLRFALRCDQDVSTEILGTKAASDIREKNGYLIVRSLELTPAQYKKYRTPYISTKALNAHIRNMALKAREVGIPQRDDVITYQEETIHPIEEIYDLYKEIGTSNVPEGTMFLGKPMIYTKNKAPINTVLSAKNNSHIMSAFQDMTDLVCFYRTILANVKSQGKGDIFINSQVGDLHYICEVENDISPEFLTLSDEKNSVKELYTIFQGIFMSRKDKGIKDKPLYIILIGWNKAAGFGLDPDAELCLKFATLLQVCGEFNMHFIFINTAMGSIRDSINKACFNQIAGRCDETTSYALVNNKLASKAYSLKNGYAFLSTRGEVKRFKIYQSEITREIKRDEFVL